MFGLLQVHTQSHVCTETELYVQMCLGQSCAEVREKLRDTQRLPSPATDTYVWPACGHKAMFAVAVV